jgi:hypothetical protein
MLKRSQTHNSPLNPETERNSSGGRKRLCWLTYVNLRISEATTPLKSAKSFLLQCAISALVIIALACFFWAAFAHAAEYDVRPIPQVQPKLLANGQILTANGLSDVFLKYPILKKIAACESTGDPNGTPRQFNSDGSVLWGNDPKTGKPIERDAGIFQINEWVWKPLAEKMGLDLATEAGNLAFGEFLYLKYGTSPWTASEGCWSSRS